MPGAERSMPAFTASPAGLVERFRVIAERYEGGGVERRRMFGYPALFVGGNLVTGLFQDRWMVRLPDAEREALLALPGAAPFEPMPGRPMRGYAVIPPDVVSDDARLAGILEQAIAHGRTLPAKR